MAANEKSVRFPRHLKWHVPTVKKITRPLGGRVRL